HSSRWYPGAGIYRHVWLDITAPVHVARWGTYVTTPEVTDAAATVAMKTSLENAGAGEARVTLSTRVVDAAGKTVASDRTAAVVPAGGGVTVESKAIVPRPRRWDIDNPYLYTVVSEVNDGAHIVDRYTTPIGIRTIEFDRTRGFLLNGRHVKMQGVCDHH